MQYANSFSCLTAYPGAYDLIPSAEEPVEHLRCAKAAIQTEHHPLSPLPGPAQTRFQLPQRCLEGRHRRDLAPQQRLVENLLVGTRCPSQDFPPGLTAVAAHP